MWAANAVCYIDSSLLIFLAAVLLHTARELVDEGFVRAYALVVEIFAVPKLGGKTAQNAVGQATRNVLRGGDGNEARKDDERETHCGRFERRWGDA